MKRYISKTLKFFAGFYATFPLTYLFIAALLFDVPAGRVLSVLLSPLFYITSLFAIFVGFGIWEMKRWAWYVFIFTNILIAYLNAWVVNVYSQSQNKGLAFGTSILLLLFLCYRVSKEIRVPYFFPRIRWWESDPRYRLSVPSHLKRSEAQEVDGEILDLSMGGCFVKLRQNLNADEPVELSFKIFGQNLSCRGVVVWRTQSTVTHPRGVGIKFDGLNREQRKQLRTVNQRLKKIATLYKRSRYLMSREDFLKRLSELESADIAKIDPMLDAKS